MKQHRRIRAEINLDHFEHNLNEIRRLISPDTKVCAVIKTDGYGHGAVALARMMETRNEIWGYAVATVEE
ncbi:MAG: alanine racemase, partial [Clostridiales bacterium]|nr:alanine racemase [Clostridiales bacterium]